MPFVISITKLVNTIQETLAALDKNQRHDEQWHLQL